MPTTKKNKWLTFVSNYAQQNNVKYSEALKSPHVKDLYNRTYVPCVMCHRKFDRFTMFSPLPCYNKNFGKAHKICKQCWFNKKNGFALESSVHKCPGCVHDLPLNPPPPTKASGETIDLLDDD